MLARAAMAPPTPSGGPRHHRPQVSPPFLSPSSAQGPSREALHPRPFTPGPSVYAGGEQHNSVTPARRLLACAVRDGPKP